VDLNVVAFTGRLGADPKMRYTPQGTAVTSFRFAVTIASEKTLWFDVTAWGRLGENVNQYLSKGARASVSGRLDQDEWEGNDGVRRTTLKIIANDVRFLDPKKDSGSSEKSDGGPEDTLTTPTLEETLDDDEFPL